MTPLIVWIIRVIKPIAELLIPNATTPLAVPSFLPSFNLGRVRTWIPPPNVRYWGESGHGGDLSVCPLMTQSGRGTKRFGNQSGRPSLGRPSGNITFASSG